MNAQTDGTVTLSVNGAVATMIFDRPHARNAMTWQMYDALLEHCVQLQTLENIRAVVLRGKGGASFIAGSDISQFQSFRTAEHGVAYEAKMEHYLDALARIPAPTVAVIEGFAVGGGLNIASCCDIRIATHGSKLGVPIARTIGNCLSIANYARLVAGFGEGRARRMMLLGDMIDVEEALTAGFLSKICQPEDLETVLGKITEQLAANAPLTLRASKVAINRVIDQMPGETEDLIRLCYGSEDFREGISAFLEKRPPQWQGR
jgi:enoyl-CoA hydratase/carnithine racemase